MFRILLIFVTFVLILPITSEQDNKKSHSDYVPDEKTAERIAEAVLMGQYGENRVSEQLPLVVDGSNKRYWMIEGRIRKDQVTMGGGFAVWIDKHSGCIGLVSESMK